MSVPFRDVTTILRSVTAGYEISAINLNIPSFAAGSRVRTFAGLYEFFRFRNLRVKVVNAVRAVGIAPSTAYYLPSYTHGVAYIPSAVASFTAPSSFDDLMQLPEAMMAPTGEPLSIRMSRAKLQGSSPVKWYHTATTGSPPAADSSAGTIVYATRTLLTQTEPYAEAYIQIEGVVEFCSPIASGDALQHTSEVIVDEKKRLRIYTDINDDGSADPRASVLGECALRTSSVPNTPRSQFGSVATVTYEPLDARSSRGLYERPRLARQ